MAAINIPAITAVDAAVSPSDLVVVSTVGNPREVTLSSAAEALTNLAEGTLFCLTAHATPAINGVYLVTSEVTENVSYTAKKQGAGPDPVDAAAGSATLTTSHFAKQLDANDGVKIRVTNSGAFSVQPQESVDGVNWVNLGAAIVAAGIRTDAGKFPWYRILANTVGTSVTIGLVV